ncbi:MAG: type II toxin-antitoxin system HicA family toxin [Gammaproteobacteria bacterium]|nr:type II toxin-antitoxin system HicA family toxin [Gammaproteobacteria bacterium]
MPPKIRELISLLQRAGFVERSGKGSHRIFEHSGGISISLSGPLGGDAKPYQVRDVRKCLKRVAH